MKQALRVTLGFFILLWAAVLHAEVRIEITQGVNSAQPATRAGNQQDRSMGLLPNKNSNQSGRGPGVSWATPRLRFCGVTVARAMRFSGEFGEKTGQPRTLNTSVG